MIAELRDETGAGIPYAPAHRHPVARAARRHRAMEDAGKALQLAAPADLGMGRSTPDLRRLPRAHRGRSRRRLRPRWPVGDHAAPSQRRPRQRACARRFGRSRAADLRPQRRALGRPGSARESETRALCQERILRPRPATHGRDLPLSPHRRRPGPAARLPPARDCRAHLGRRHRQHHPADPRPYQRLRVAR